MMEVQLYDRNNDEWVDLSEGVKVLSCEWTPSPQDMEWLELRRFVADKIVSAFGVPSVVIHANARPFLRELDRAQRSLNRLRYPPKAPTKGVVSRRREKLRKAGLRYR